jgi:hypothetical protein
MRNVVGVNLDCRSRLALPYDAGMPTTTETLQVSGIRCERCMDRLRTVLTGHPGLEAANANLLGHVTLTWDDDITDRGALLASLARGGFRPVEVV